MSLLPYKGLYAFLGLARYPLSARRHSSDIMQTGHAQNATAAAGLIQDAAKDPVVLAAAQGLVTAVRTSALTNGGWSVAVLAADPAVQAAIVPVLAAAANSGALNWAEVDPSVVPAAAAPKVTATGLTLGMPHSVAWSGVLGTVVL